MKKHDYCNHKVGEGEFWPQISIEPDFKAAVTHPVHRCNSKVKGGWPLVSV